MPDFSCDARATKPFPHIWEHTVGSGHAPLALRADWQKHLLRCHNELGFRYVRFHALLSDEMGTLICQENKLLYSFFNADQIVDYLLSIGMRPFIELSFMPETLASGSTTVFHYRANVTPPRNYEDWATLIHKLTAHWIDRYGADEVRQWFFEVWNEPNLEAFWTGPQEGYFKLYRSTVKAIKSVDEGIKVGGPATANNKWIPDFLDYCSKHSLAVDFISTHHYPTDAFGKPGADTESQLEHAPKGTMRDQARKSREQACGHPLYYTEWNISSNPRDPLHDQPFAAAFATSIIMGAQGLVDGYSFWTFSDIFSENYFPSVPFHGGFGLMNLHGIPKPAYRAFELLHSTGFQSLDVSGSHPTVQVWAIRGEQTIAVAITNLAMPRHPIQSESVHIRLSNASRPSRASIQRVDEDHANPAKLWHSMGQPEYLSRRDVESLESASELKKESQPWTYDQGNTEIAISMPVQSLALVELEFEEIALSR